MSETKNVSLKGNPNLRVYIIDEESKKMDISLGITDERSDELIEAVRESLNNCDTHIEAFENMSKVAKHANELAYMIYNYGVKYGETKAKMEGMSSGLDDLLKKLKGNNSEE